MDSGSKVWAVGNNWLSVVHHCFAHIVYTKKRPTQGLHNYKMNLSYYNR